MKHNTVRIKPGESVEIMVLHDPRYGGVQATIYDVMTPTWGQDDGTGGNIFVKCVSHPETGESDNVVASPGDDAEHLDFGDPTVDPFINGKVIRLAYQSF